MAKTHADFQESGRFRYEGCPVGEAEGHAMVLVGIRKDASNQVFFLLQNFWNEKQFDELRQDFLMQSVIEKQFQRAFVFVEGPFDEV